MKKLILFLFLVATSVAGLSAQKYERVIDTQARANDAVSGIFIKPTVAEVKLLGNGQRVSDEWTLSRADFEALHREYANVRAWATHMSSVKHNCDIIMAATYKIESDPVTGEVMVTIVGYPGNFVNWHPATDEDFLWIYNQRYYNKVENPVVKEKE